MTDGAAGGHVADQGDAHPDDHVAPPEVDERTAPSRSRRRGASADAPIDESTMPVARLASPDDEATRLAVRGRDRPPAAPEADPDEGSTIIVRRESRRRAERERIDVDEPERPGAPAVSASTAPVATVFDPLSRTARGPDLSGAYGVRTAPRGSPPRATAPARDPQHLVDGAAIDALVRRRARRRAGTVIAGASLLVVAAVAALVVLIVVA